MKRLGLLCIVGLAPLALGQSGTVIREWSGHYQLNEHYKVEHQLI